jgi:hypothetical protein
MAKFYLICLLLLYACSWQQRNKIPHEVQPYLKAFEQEALHRGINIDLSELRVTFDTALSRYSGNTYPLEPNAVAARKSFWSPPLIILDTTLLWWKNAESCEKVIFHELGHCILNREHKDELLPNGEGASILNTYNNLTRYTQQTRDYYLNELFYPGTPPPTWGMPQYSYQKRKQLY